MCIVVCNKEMREEGREGERKGGRVKEQEC